VALIDVADATAEALSRRMDVSEQSKR